MRPHKQTCVHVQKNLDTLKILVQCAWVIATKCRFLLVESIYISTQLFTAIYFTFMFVSTKLLAGNERLTWEDLSEF